MRPVTKWGQNFLVNTGVLEKIVDFSSLTRNDCVVEIGSGVGNLTRHLSRWCGKVLAFEIDPVLFQKTVKALSDLDNVIFFNHQL